MPINKETIISVFTEKLTLEQWLKTINKALDEAVLTGVEIAKKGNATLSFKFTFEDGTFLESNDIVLQQGESVQSAYIQNGHLYLTLTNGTNLDAGNVKPVSNFSIDANQHLIVNYQDGTSQDLGAIFNGNVNISGTLNATKVTGDEIVENMSGYSAVLGSDTNFTYEKVYVGACKNGNKLTLVVALNLTKGAGAGGFPTLCTITIPASVASKLYPTQVGQYNFLDNRVINIFASNTSYVAGVAYVSKNSNNLMFVMSSANMVENTKYYVRYEATFLLGNDIAE